jgi:hypothetical protein
MAEINLKKLTAGVSEIDVNFNGTLEGQADATIPLNVNLTDGVSDITPTSVALTGNDLDIIIPTPIIPSGVLLQFPIPDNYTSYRTGDVGWRVQNNWFNYVPPINPKVIAELDYSLGANYWARLKNPLIVGGVSNTLRFVDVDGGQTFSATGNKNLITIDKYTGLGMTRTDIGNALNWDNAIDNALAHSIVVNGITYDNFYLRSLIESILIFGNEQTNQTLIDPITSVILNSASTGSTSALVSTSTIGGGSSTYNHQSLNQPRSTLKTSGTRQIFIFDATSLITAP